METKITNFESMLKNTLSHVMQYDDIETVRQQVINDMLSEITSLNHEVNRLSDIVTNEGRTISHLEGKPVIVSLDVYDEILLCLNSDQKIRGIKTIRNVTKLGLLEAKGLYEKMQYGVK